MDFEGKVKTLSKVFKENKDGDKWVGTLSLENDDGDKLTYSSDPSILDGLKPEETLRVSFLKVQKTLSQSINKQDTIGE